MEVGNSSVPNKGVQFPCLKYYENDIVLDPMCGSGTTCVAAKKLNRNYIGIDISEEYCNIARNRINGLD